MTEPVKANSVKVKLLFAVIFCRCTVFYFVMESFFGKKTFSSRVGAVRVKGETSLRNGTWHGLRNDIIKRIVIYNVECLKEIN